MVGWLSVAIVEYKFGTLKKSADEKTKGRVYIYTNTLTIRKAAPLSWYRLGRCHIYALR